MGERMREEAYKLAMLVLQSDFYSKPSVKETVDDILALYSQDQPPPTPVDWYPPFPKLSTPTRAEWEEWVGSWPYWIDISEEKERLTRTWILSMPCVPKE